jgi:hypothetical protein
MAAFAVLGSACVTSVAKTGFVLPSVAVVTGAGLTTVTVTSNEPIELPAKLLKLNSGNTIAQMSRVT